MTIETAHLVGVEDFWWNTKELKASEDLKDRIIKFSENYALYQTNESFAYEGIFDKVQQKPAPQIKFEKTQVDRSHIGRAPKCKHYFCNPIIAQMGDKFYNTSNILLRDEFFTNAPSPISDISNKSKIVNRINKKNSFINTINNRGRPINQPIDDQGTFSSSLVK